VKAIRYFSDEAERLGRPQPMPILMRAVLKLLALLAPKDRVRAARRFAGYMLLEPAPLA
jgi:hypothetical protein